MIILLHYEEGERHDKREEVKYHKISNLEPKKKDDVD